MISYEEFKKVEIRAGKIISAEKIPNTDKLLKLMVDFGEAKEIESKAGDVAEVTENMNPDSVKTIVSASISDSAPVSNSTATSTMMSASRQIISGIAHNFPDPAVLVGKTCMFVTNLAPRVICGHESNGMLFAISTPEGGFSLLEPNETIMPGMMAV